MYRKCFTCAVLALFTGMMTANADLIVVSTLPANNQANLTADAGQTFTTGTLGLDTLLSTIEIEGPQTDPGGASPLGPFFVELWTDTDGNHAPWDPGALVATSVNQGTMVAGGATITTFNFAGESSSPEE